MKNICYRILILQKILLDLRNPVKSRHLDSIKRERLGVIFQREILEIMEQSSELTNYRISISKVPEKNIIILKTQRQNAFGYCL